MPEQNGITRTIRLPELPTDDLFVQQTLRTFGWQERLGQVEERYNRLFSFLKRQQDALQATYDELAKRINELPELVGLRFFQSNVAANQTNVALSDGGSDRGHPAPDWGSIVCVVVTSNEARTAGTLTVEPIVTAASDGTVTASGLTAVLDATNTRTKATIQDAGFDRFNQGDLVGCRITTTAGWLPTSADVDVVVGVTYQYRTR